MAGAGLLTIIVLLIGVPLALLRDIWRLSQSRAQKFRSFNPVEQNLQRASHGAAYIILPVAAAAKLGGVGAMLSGFAPNARLLLTGAYAALAAVGLARFGFGWRRCAGIRDGLLAGRAFVKLALGIVLLCWRLPHDPIAPSLYPWLAAALFLAALWLTITGSVRFIILAHPRGAALPEVADNIADNEFDWNR